MSASEVARMQGESGSHCCDRMTLAVQSTCEQHPDRFDCPDALLTYSRDPRQYGILVHDGGHSFVAISFCPWCGSALSS